VQFQRVVEARRRRARATSRRRSFTWASVSTTCASTSRRSLSSTRSSIGGGTLYFGSTLQWLAQLASQLPEPADIIRRVGRYGADQLKQFNNNDRGPLQPAPLSDGPREVPTTAAFDEASPLRQVQRKGSTFYVQARSSWASRTCATTARSPRSTRLPRIQDALDEGVQGVEDVGRMRDLAWLERARLYYSTRHYDSAVEAWNRVNVDSEYWLDALFESRGRTSSQQDYARALGNIHTLNSPYFNTRSTPRRLC
jgi:hypothetical protein